MVSEFHKKYSPEERKKECDRICAKYPDRYPVIVQKTEGNSSLPELKSKKFLVPKSVTVGQFVYCIRKRIKLTPEQALFIFINNTLPPTGSLMSEVYQAHKDQDGFLYAYISGESTFGA